MKTVITEFLAEIGRKGGKARAKALTPERCREIAMMGVAAKLKYANDRRREEDEAENTCHHCGVRGCMGECIARAEESRQRAFNARNAGLASGEARRKKAKEAKA